MAVRVTRRRRVHRTRRHITKPPSPRQVAARARFKEAVEYCKMHRLPGEKLQACVSSYLRKH